MERKKFILPTALILGLLFVNDVGVANAAYVFDNNAAVTEISGGLSGGGAGFGTTFQTQLSNLSKDLLASAKIIAVIMTAAAGCMVCFGINDGKKTFWNWILGIGLAINFGDLILNLWSVESVSAPTKIEDYKLLMKSEDDPSVDILSPFMRYYIGVIMSGAAVIAPYAVNLTLLLAMIDGAIKVAFDLISGDKIKFLVMMILKVGFFIFLIHSWVGTNSSYQLMPALSSGFETMGYTAGGAEEMVKEYDRANPDSNIEVQSNQIVTNALNFFNIFWEHAQQQNLLTIFIGLVCVVAAVVILFLTALEMFMVRIEFWTMALITIPLLPFGVIGQLKFLSDKAIGTMFNLAIKIFVVAFIATLSVNILTGLVDNARETATSSDFIGNISYFLQVLLYALILFYMTKKIPELVSGLLSGNPSLSGGSMKEMVMSAARGAANAVSRGGGFAGAVAGGMKALSEAAGPMAKYGGKGNFGANALSFANAAGGKAMSMMGQAVKAGTNAAMYRNPAYQGYQDAISLLGNKSNGLLTKPNANGGGVTPKETLQNLSGSQPATTATQKICVQNYFGLKFLRKIKFGGINMKKFVLSVLVCLLLATTSANAAILKDNEGFSYIISYNYLMFDGGSHACTVYDLSSTHILADNNQRFEFNVIELLIGYHGEEIMGKRISNIREDYDTGKIYRDGQLLDNKRFWHGKTQREIYYKMKSAALSR